MKRYRFDDSAHYHGLGSFPDCIYPKVQWVKIGPSHLTIWVHMYLGCLPGRCKICEGLEIKAWSVVLPVTALCKVPKRPVFLFWSFLKPSFVWPVCRLPPEITYYHNMVPGPSLDQIAENCPKTMSHQPLKHGFHYITSLVSQSKTTLTAPVKYN